MEVRGRSGRVQDYNIEKYRKLYWRADEYARRAEQFIQKQGFFFLPTLEFAWYKGCLPLLSSYQIRVHYDRHHRAYVETLNKLIEGTSLYGYNLDEIIRKVHGDETMKGILNNAAQHYNHSFFWKTLVPMGSNIPPDLSNALASQYGSVEELKNQFCSAALSLFGSGWVYLVYDKRVGRFDVVSYPNAGCPLVDIEVEPMLCLDLWEHSYYIDYENDRAKYVANFFDVVDWHWAERRWKLATGQPYDEMDVY
jgi:Fe-Mn family superoxide dismutase